MNEFTLAMKRPLLLISIIVLAALLRAPGLFWGYVNNDGLQPDEGQHVGIARILLNKYDDEFIEDYRLREQFNARGFGTQIAVIGYPFLKLFGLDSTFLFPVGRLLSLLYSLALIFLTFQIAKKLFGSWKIGLLSALLLSVFDLNVTYSHYGTPDIASVFWAYLACFAVLFYLDPSKPLTIVLTGAALAMPLAFRFDIIPLAIFCLYLGHKYFAQKISLNRAVFVMLIAGAMAVLAFFASVAFNYGLEDIKYSYQVLIHENQDGIAKDNHLVYNPLLYVVAVIGGTSFLATFFAFAGGLYATMDNHIKKGRLAFFLIFLMLEFLVLYIGDATFVRRANIFLPFLSILAALGLAYAGRKTPDLGRWLLAGAIGYTLILTLVSQSNFVFDTRYLSKGYIEGLPGVQNDITYSPYMLLNGFPDGEYMTNLTESGREVNTTYLVMHESYYSRYWKYFTTPFKVPDCCDESFHCKYNDCVFIQSIFRGESEYRLIRSYDTMAVLPERAIFKHFFGTYETFLGDLKIYQREN